MIVIPKKGTFARNQVFYPETEEERAIFAAREEREKKAKAEQRAQLDKLLADREELIEAERKAKYEAGRLPIVTLARFLVDRIEHSELRRIIAAMSKTNREDLTNEMLAIWQIDEDDFRHGRRVPQKVQH